MVVHLSTRGGILCRSTRHNPRVSTDLQFVTCSWCFHTLERVSQLEADAMWERRIEAQWLDAVTTLGVTDLWESLGTDTPSERMIRSVLGSVLVGLVESRAEARLRAAASAGVSARHVPA